MNIITTIVPIFAVILIGWLARRKGFMPPEFFSPANRLVFYVALPAMIFKAISGASLKVQFNGLVVGIALATAVIALAFAWAVAAVMRLKHQQLGTFVQDSFHGNLGYVGLAVAYYYLGSEGLARAGIIASFMMIWQNLLAVIVLQVNSQEEAAAGGWQKVVGKIIGNPIIIAALAGILFSLSGLSIPAVIGRCLDILSDLALPLALLIIGGSLSFEMVRMRPATLLLCAAIKLIALPALGYGLYRVFGLGTIDYLPAIILLASPTATVSYVMAREMKGDADFAVAAISTSTLLSALTFAFWLHVGG
jgi:predicted permease